MNQLYRKLAVINIKSNRQFYLPYLLTGMLSVTMFYTMRAMQGNQGLDKIRGGAELILIFTFGTIVTAIFVGILLFYTNSFIIKRRKKELGIYNILGMEKKHIAKIMFWETLIAFLISVVGGLLFGIGFNKLFTMILYQLTGLKESIPFAVSGYGCLQTVELFGIIYGAAFLYNFMQIQLANPITLLRSSYAGEKEPKTKAVMATVGAICIGIAYYISITTEKPLDALVLFFVAVLLVIAGTYLLFTAGSIAFLKLLRKKKTYYYQTRHFTVVSGMIYRMKQNAVGLANICILSTMVLVVISSTVSMYIGLEEELKSRYSAELTVHFYYKDLIKKENLYQIRQTIEEWTQEKEAVIQSEQFYMERAAYLKGNRILLTPSQENEEETVVALYIMTKEEYEKIVQTEQIELKEEEIFLSSTKKFTADTVNFNGKEYQVAKAVKLPSESSFHIVDMIYLVVKDEDTFSKMVQDTKKTLSETEKKVSANSLPLIEYQFAIEFDGTKEEKLAFANEIREKGEDVITEVQKSDFYSFYVESKEEGRESFLIFNGGFLFLGLFFGGMFLLITVLIIYYKQISEGYEDKERFAILQKVGMSKDEIKATIQTQIKTVFFLPLFTASIHLAAAFPMLRRLLALLNLTNSTVFAWCLVGTVLLFGGIYLGVFLLTSQSYYRIVGK